MAYCLETTLWLLMVYSWTRLRVCTGFFFALLTSLLTMLTDIKLDNIANILTRPTFRNGPLPMRTLYSTNALLRSHRMFLHHHSLFLSLPPCLAGTRMGCLAQSRYVSWRKHTNAQLAPAPHEVNRYQVFSDYTASSYRRSPLVSCTSPWSVPSRSCSPSAAASESLCYRPHRKVADMCLALI